MAQILPPASAQSVSQNGGSQYEGKLFRTPEDGAIYLVLDGHSSHIQTMDVYRGLFGEKQGWTTVSIQDWKTKYNLISGPPLTATPPLITAPAGGKVYLVYYGLKRWIKNPDTFNKYAFDWNTIAKVNVDSFTDGPDI